MSGSLFDKDEFADWKEHWQGMPEFVQEDATSWTSIIVHFASREDMDAFAKLVGQTIRKTTQSIWFPEAEIGRMSTKRYVTESYNERNRED